MYSFHDIFSPLKDLMLFMEDPFYLIFYVSDPTVEKIQKFWNCSDWEICADDIGSGEAWATCQLKEIFEKFGRENNFVSKQFGTVFAMKLHIRVNLLVTQSLEIGRQSFRIGQASGYLLVPDEEGVTGHPETRHSKREIVFAFKARLMCEVEMCFADWFKWNCLILTSSEIDSRVWLQF